MTTKADIEKLFDAHREKHGDLDTRCGYCASYRSVLEYFDFDEADAAFERRELATTVAQIRGVDLPSVRRRLIAVALRHRRNVYVLETRNTNAVLRLTDDPRFDAVFDRFCKNTTALDIAIVRHGGEV